MKNLISGLIVAIVGGVIVAILAGEGRFAPPPTPLPHTPLPPISASPTPTLKLITITLINNHCEAEDLYIDGKLTVAAIAAGASSTFQIAPGEHSTYLCAPDTTSCADTVQQNWSTSTTLPIAHGSTCPITISLTNDNCSAEDYYVDGKLVVAAIAAGASSTFQIAPGEHSAYACYPGTSNCGGVSPANWSTSTAMAAIITRNPACPITISLTNDNCSAEDYYVDGKLVVAAIAAGASSTFQIAPGEHSAYACYPGTSNCGGVSPANWSTSTAMAAIITRNPACP